MTNKSWKHAAGSLKRLRECLDIYSAALADWQQTMDQATSRIACLSSTQADLLADEIEEVRKNRLEYFAIKERVEAGWTLYRRLSAQMEFENVHINSGSLSSSSRVLN